VKLLSDLVDSLVRQPESMCSFGTCDRVAAVESGVGEERIQALTVLARYPFNTLSDRVEK
jgi:hypothetical protein